MKKAIVVLILTVFCVFVISFAWKTFFPKEEAALDQTNNTFVVKGDVNVRKAGADAPWQKMTPSTVLEKGDIVETGKDSAVTVVIGANTEKTVRVGEKSRVEFQGVNPTKLNIPEGKLLVALKKLEPKSSFVVKTPTAICGARGTAWLEEVSPEKTRVSVFESEIFARELNAKGEPKSGEHIINIGIQRILERGKPISEAEPVWESDLAEWKYWDKSVEFLREGKILVNSFDRKENFNNLGGDFGCWNMFYSDPTQSCRDEFSDIEKMGDTGYSLKVIYDVDSQFSAYNGFFTKLMDIDISNYRYLIFYIKGDAAAGFSTRVKLELKNRLEIGRTTLEGITDQWKKMVIPLNRFAGIRELKEMKEFVIIFSDNTVTKKEGAVYLDDIYFAKEEPAGSE